jgi:serine O-acetyltransferase (EC 2.3.1.30)
MSPEFYKQIFNAQQQTEVVPPNQAIANWALNLIRLLYPERSETKFSSPAEIEKAFKQLEHELVDLLNATKACCDDDNAEKASTFLK